MLQLFALLWESPVSSVFTDHGVGNIWAQQLCICCFKRVCVCACACTHTDVSRYSCSLAAVGFSCLLWDSCRAAGDVLRGQQPPRRSSSRTGGDLRALGSDWSSEPAEPDQLWVQTPLNFFTLIRDCWKLEAGFHVLDKIDTKEKGN